MKKRHSALFFFALSSVFFIELFAQNNLNLQDIYQLNIGRTTESIKIDGALEEQVWKTSAVATDFWVSYPTDGIRASPEVQTLVRMTYDDEFIYVSAECIGPGPYIIQSLKRDNPLFWRGDAFGLVFDPVNEKSNGFVFAVNPTWSQVAYTLPVNPPARKVKPSRFGVIFTEVLETTVTSQSIISPATI